MYNCSDDVIRLPNTIVNVAKVDDEGELWFTCDKPAYQPEQYCGIFPVRLQFYRKGKLFRLEISGPAEIVDDLRDENEVLANRLLIKMKMKNISYSETQEKTRVDARQWINKAYRYLSSLPGYSPADKANARALKIWASTITKVYKSFTNILGKLLPTSQTPLLIPGVFFYHNRK